MLISATLAAAMALAPSKPYFDVQLRPGQTVENIFERTLFRETPHRISGYAVYHISGVGRDRVDFVTSASYYGRGSVVNLKSSALLRADGLYYGADKPTLATDSSGAFFNNWIWGKPPARLAAGTTWRYRIPAAWELGPSGVQTATVLSLDPLNDRIVLQRVGSGVGAPLGETLPKIDGVTPAWGKTTWKGVTIVRRGLIESDEVAVRHELIVPRSATKPQHVVIMIEQIELGQVPYGGGLP